MNRPPEDGKKRNPRSISATNRATEKIPPQDRMRKAPSRPIKTNDRRPPERARSGGKGQASHRKNIRKKGNIIPDAVKKFFTPRVTMYFVIGSVVLLLGICMLINILIGVREVEIVGADMTERDELMMAAGIEEGSGYFSYNTGSSEENVLRLIPCVSEVDITRSVFGKVTITVTEKKAYWYAEVFDEYYALSEELQVIRRSKHIAPFVARGLVRLDFPEVKSAILGKIIEFSDEGRDCSFVSEFLSEVRSSKLYEAGRIDQICMETKFEIYAVCDMKYKIFLGKYSNAKVKLDTVIKALESELLSGEGKWQLDVSNISNITSRKDNELDFGYLYPEN